MQVNVVVTDANGFTVTSTSANLRVAPGITLQPLSQSAADGSNVVFTVTDRRRYDPLLQLAIPFG